jgi:hypothetical protein
MGYEDRFLNKLDKARVDIQHERRLENREELTNLIKTIVPQEYESASSYLKASALQLGSFRDLYGYENVGRDMEKVKSLKEIFAENEKSNFNGGTTMAEVRKLSEITE